MHPGILLQHPVSAAAQLFLLFHGVGGRPDQLQPLGQSLAAAFPEAMVVSVRAPHRSDVAFGWQWYSVRGIDAAQRASRVAQALPEFLACVRDWQAQAGLTAAATTLVGFSQGATMALESCLALPPAAGRVVSLGGRFARAPAHAPPGVRVHLLHGEADPVISCACAVEACEQLQQWQTEVTLDLFPGLGHEIDARMTARLLERLVA